MSALPTQTWLNKPNLKILEWLENISFLFCQTDPKNFPKNLSKIQTSDNPKKHDFSVLSYLASESDRISRSKSSYQNKSDITEALSQVMTEFLDLSDGELVSGKEIEFLFDIDKKKREVGLFEECRRKNTFLYRNLLRHRMSERILDFVSEADTPEDNTPQDDIKDEQESKSFKLDDSSILTPLICIFSGIFYPILSILSIFIPFIRKFMSSYPITYYLNWGSYLWLTIILYIYHTNYDQGPKFSWLILILLIFLISKIVEEFEAINSSSKHLKFKHKFNAYLFDIWNYIDFMSVTFLSAYLLCHFTYFMFASSSAMTAYIPSDYDYSCGVPLVVRSQSPNGNETVTWTIDDVQANKITLEQFKENQKSLKHSNLREAFYMTKKYCQQIQTVSIIKDVTFLLSMLTSCTQLTQVFSLSRVLGNATEATLLMVSWALGYLLIACMYFAGFIAVGTTILKEDSFTEMTGRLTRLLFGLVDPDAVDPFLETGAGHFYIVAFYLFILVIVLNGLISIMTTSLGEDMSEANTRQRSNYTKYELIGHEVNNDYWPNPFSLMARILRKCCCFRKKKEAFDHEALFQHASGANRPLPRVSFDGRAEEEAMVVLSTLHEDEDDSNQISQRNQKIVYQSIKLAITYLLNYESIAYLYLQNPKRNLFLILSKMVKLFHQDDIKDELSEYFDENYFVLHKQFDVEGYTLTTPLHLAVKYGNIGFLKLTFKFLKDCPTDEDGKEPLEYLVDYNSGSKSSKDKDKKEMFLENILMLINQNNTLVNDKKLLLSICNHPKDINLLKSAHNNGENLHFSSPGPNSTSPSKSPINTAISNNNIPAIKFLLDKVNCDLNYESILILSKSGNIDTLEAIQSARLKRQNKFRDRASDDGENGAKNLASWTDPERGGNILHYLAANLSCQADPKQFGDNKDLDVGTEYVKFIYCLLRFLTRDEGAKINHTDFKGNTIFHTLAYREDKNYNYLLLAFNWLASEKNRNQKSIVSIDQENDEGLTPLTIAVILRSAENVENFLKLGANANYKLKLNWTPLSWAVNQDTLECLKLLVTIGKAKPSSNMKTVSPDGLIIFEKTNLAMWAILKSSFEVIKYVIEEFCYKSSKNYCLDINASDTKNGSTLCHYISFVELAHNVKNTRLDVNSARNILKILFKEPSLDLRRRNNAGSTPSDFAVERLDNTKHEHNRNILKEYIKVFDEFDVILDNQARPYWTDCIEKVMEADYEKLEAFFDEKYQKFLLENNNDSLVAAKMLKDFVNEPDKLNNMTPLHFITSSRLGNVGTAVNPKQPKPSMETRVLIGNLLISKGAEQKRDNNGELPIHKVARKGYLKVAELILDSKHGQRTINEVELKNGMSAIYFAVLHSHFEVVKLLNQHGCSQELKSLDAGSGLHKNTSEMNRPLPFMILNIRIHGLRMRMIDLFEEIGFKLDTVERNGNNVLHQIMHYLVGVGDRNTEFEISWLTHRAIPPPSFP